MYKTVTLKANAQKIITCKMHVIPNMYKIATLKADAKEIASLWKCVWHQICTKLITLKANAKEHHYLKMHLTPHMYKIVTLHGKCKGNCSLENAFDTCICTKSLLWRQMLRIITDKMCLPVQYYCTKTCTLKANATEHQLYTENDILTPHMYKIITLKAECQGNLFTLKCIWSHKIVYQIITLKANA